MTGSYISGGLTKSILCENELCSRHKTSYKGVLCDTYKNNLKGNTERRTDHLV